MISATRMLQSVLGPGGLIVAACFGLSILAWIPMLPDRRTCVILMISGLAGLSHRYSRPAAVLLLAAGWACWQAHQVFAVIPQNLINGSTTVSGQVVGLPRQSAGLQQFIVLADQPDWLADKRLRVNWYRPEHSVLPGEQWQFDGKIRPVYGAVNPQGFDAARWMLSMRVSGTLSVKTATQLTPARDSIGQLRTSISDWVRQTLPVSSAATISALVTGERGSLSAEQKDMLLATGTGHLLAISGMHIGMVGMLGWLLGRLPAGIALIFRLRIAQHPVLYHMPFCICLLSAAGYAVLSGFAVSSARALAMLLIGGLAIVGRRRFPASRIMLTALSGVLLLNPLIVLGAGFWLSFTAVFWLWWCLQGRLSGGVWLRQLIRIQVVLMLGMLPLQLGWFQQLSLVSLPANLIAIPLVSLLILPVLLFSVLLHLVYLPGGDSMLQLAGVLVQYLLHALHWLSKHSFSAIELTPNEYWWSYLMAVFGCLWFFAPRGVPYRVAGLLLILPLLFPADNPPGNDHWAVYLFDVGQGQAMAVRTAGHVLVYDTGPGDGAGRDRIRSSMLPIIRHWGGKVDKVLISHGDLDHAGGFQTVKNEWRDAQVISSKHSLGTGCHDQQSWQWDGVKFQILHPSAFLPYLGNDSSCVLLVESRHGSMLIPGDISTSVERRLVNSDQNLRADLLIAAHHGSKSSSSDQWLRAVAPRMALVSAGRWNRFDMPHAEVLQRYSQYEIDLYNTADCGALSVSTTESGGLKITAARLSETHWWLDKDYCRVQPAVMK